MSELHGGLPLPFIFYIMNKDSFYSLLSKLVLQLNNYVCSEDWQWKIKWFIDELLNIYTISSDTKIISKILEIHIFPLILDFANKNWFILEPAHEQNWYPDISLILKSNPNVKFAIDFKSTYRTWENKCNWFTLWSHGEYFINRESTKNIQYPYNSYLWHFCLGMIYDKAEIDIDETEIYDLDSIKNIRSVISNITFFVQEKRKIASDRGWSWNTANIWSITDIDKLIKWEWVFIYLWEHIFDEYWMNQWKMMVIDKKWVSKKLTKIEEYLQIKNVDLNLINKPQFRW